MQLKKSIFTFICILAVLFLCAGNTSYAWESLEQSAVNMNTGEAAKFPDNPKEPEGPDFPDDPKEPEKTEKKPEDSSVQIGKADADTGDTHQFLFYLFLMLFSFVMIIVIGVTMILFTINIVEKCRK